MWQNARMRYRFGSKQSTLALLVWVLVLSFPLNLTAQQSEQNSSNRRRQQAASHVRFTSGNSALNIPLEIDNNIILMLVSVNNSKPLKFIFDTGASHTVISSARAAELGLKSEGEVSGTATGGAIHGSYVKGVSLSVQGAEVSNQLIASLPFPTVPGFEFDGVIGYDFINEFVVEIDYLKKILNLYNPRTYIYKGRGGIIPLALAGRTPLARTTIMLEKGRSVNAVLEIDTGADGTLVIHSPFVKKHGLLSAITDTTASAGRGAGGEQKRIVARVKAVRLGRFVFNNPPVALALEAKPGDTSEENDGVVGGEIFRRFKVIIDYSRQRMILEPNKSFNNPFELETGEE
jgi:predicted aspartyl protease